MKGVKGMNFAEAMKNETKWTRTENGAVALNTTGTACLDLFGTIGALRKEEEYLELFLNMQLFITLNVSDLILI